MATALGGLGQYAEAESMARESATALCALLGVNSPECIRADGVRLRLWIPTGSQAELDVLSNDVLTRANRVFGPDTTETLTYIIDRSTVLERFDQYEAMREVMLDFINRVERTRGKDHAFLVRPLARLGDLERILTHQDKAMEYFDRAIALARQHEQTSMIAALLMRRGDSFRRMERNAEAKVDFDESARLMKPDSAELAQLQQMRGVLASAELDFEAAIAHLKSSQIVFEKALGKATVYSWTSVIARIGIELKRANAKHQALPAGLLQEAIDADAAMHALSPPPSFDVFLSRGTLAQVHAALKQDQEALKRFEEAIQVGVKVYSADHPSVLEAQVQQAEIMRAHDRVKAEQILRQVLATPTLTEKLKAQAQAVLDLN